VNGKDVPESKQAEEILKQADIYLASSKIKGLSITYSANISQTNSILKTYENGNWRTGVSGENQAQVMQEMESLLSGTIYSHLQNSVRISPITTIPSDVNDVNEWMTQLSSDMNEVESLLKKDWIVLGWINQDSKPNYAHAQDSPNGVIKHFPPKVSSYVQNSLHQFSLNYPK
jgi:hypothetical protein